VLKSAGKGQNKIKEVNWIYQIILTASECVADLNYREKRCSFISQFEASNKIWLKPKSTPVRITNITI